MHLSLFSLCLCVYVQSRSKFTSPNKNLNINKLTWCNKIAKLNLLLSCSLLFISFFTPYFTSHPYSHQMSNDLPTWPEMTPRWPCGSGRKSNFLAAKSNLCVCDGAVMMTMLTGFDEMLTGIGEHWGEMGCSVCGEWGDSLTQRLWNFSNHTTLNIKRILL